MSFLAQLRQQPTGEQGLKLCYLLQVQPATQSVNLSLSLVEFRQGQPVYPGKPYFLQNLHLQRPPSFLQTDDIALLQLLIKLLPQWSQQSQGDLPESSSEIFIRRLIDSQRCFIESKTVWLPVQSGSKQAVDLFWQINAIGEQQLRWRSQNMEILFVGSTTFVYHIQGQTCTLSTTSHNLSQAAIMLATSQTGNLPPQSVEDFLNRYQSHWQQHGLPCPQMLAQRDVASTVSPVLHCYSLSSSGAAKDMIELKFRYSSSHYCVTLNANSENHGTCYWNGTELLLLSRQTEQESLYQQQLASFLSEWDSINIMDTGLRWHSARQRNWQVLLTESRLQLEAEGFQFLIAPDFRHHYILADHWQVTIDQDSNNSQRLLLELSVDGTSYGLSNLLGQLRCFNLSQHAGEPGYFELPDGRLLLMPSAALTNLINDLEGWFQYSEQGFSIPNNQLYRLYELQQQLPTKTEWQGNLAALNNAIKLHQTPLILDHALSNVKAELRTYQWLGVCWLQHLKRCHANGLLADDMGLGKTLQTLSHLSLEQQQGSLKQAALIIAPASLLHNWACEIKRFTPHLRHCVLHGQQRHQYWSQLDDYHILISSYQSVSKDLAHWQQHKLSWVILDEAQVIKNPRTRTRQALRQLDSEYRLCLSGTPVENHLGELWSLMDFLMPGCLGSHKTFKSHYQKPIEEQGDGHKLQQLLKRIAPFMLRRSKDQVAQDLPTKTDIDQHIPLNDDQQAFYDQIKRSGSQELLARLPEENHRGQQQILLLSALLKLRQACCDPQLLGEKGISSAKREHCIEMISELVAEKRAILVFSQFTSMLELLASDLQARSIHYQILSGQTRQRQHLVDAFQQGKVPVFLISLKAGGVGLNLTRADTVIHYDPWWNSAAEQQATDRAHRIGQDKPVFVYKLISNNTIEEKIAQLQQRKALLSGHINDQAQLNGSDFALKLEDLLNLWQEATSS